MQIGVHFCKFGMPNRVATHRRQSYCVFNRVAKKQKYNQLSMAHGFGSGSVFVVCCLCLIGVLFLFTINSVTTQGNIAQEVQQKIDNLSKENEKLMLKEAELRSLDKIGEAVEGKMKIVSEPVYIDSESLVVSN